jgi:hypothetical protein
MNQYAISIRYHNVDYVMLDAIVEVDHTDLHDEAILEFAKQYVRGFYDDALAGGEPGPTKLPMRVQVKPIGPLTSHPTGLIVQHYKPMRELTFEYTHTPTRLASHWDENPDHPVEDWVWEVINGDTRIGYMAWIAARLEAPQVLSKPQPATNQG